MAYITGFFLVFAGMLIGYFLWYRDRSSEENELLNLQRETESLRKGLIVAQNGKLEIEERLVRQKGQLSVLQQLCEDWSNNRQQADRDRAQLVVEIEDKRKKQEESLADVQRFKQKQIELEDRIHQLTREQLQKTTHIEQVWQKKYIGVESTLFQHQTELKQSVKENDRLAKSLHQAESRIAELKSEISSNKKLLETATKNASGLKKEYVSLDSSLKENLDQLKQARGETAAALSEKRLAEQSLNEAQQQIKQLKADLDEQRKKLGSNQGQEKELNSLKESLANYQQQLAMMTQQRDQALKSEQSTVAASAGLQTRLNNQESTIHKLRDQQREALEKLKYELQLRSDLEATYEEHCKTLESKFCEQQKKVELQSSESSSTLARQAEQLKRQLETQSAEMKSLQRKKDSLQGELNQARGQLEKTKTDFAASEKKFQVINVEAAKLKAETLRIANLEKSIATLEARLKQESEQGLAAKQRTSQLENQLKERDQRLKKDDQAESNSQRQAAEFARKLQEQGVQVSKEREKSEALDRKTRELQQQLVALESQLTEQRRLNDSLQKQLAAAAKKSAELEKSQGEQGNVLSSFESLKRDHARLIQNYDGRLKENEETINDLKAEKVKLLEEVSDLRSSESNHSEVIPFRQALEARKQTSFDSEYGGHTSRDSIRGIIFTEEPKTKDDLKLISGIAEVLEAKLNDHGIYTFKQIMEWSPEAIAEFGRLLHFKDRIYRENWQGQAKKMYYEKLRKQTRNRAA